jgi:hypothetical protein
MTLKMLALGLTLIESPNAGEPVNVTVNPGNVITAV